MLRRISFVVIAFSLTGCSLLGGTPGQELDDLIVGVHYVGIAVEDIEASARFYESSFDVEPLGTDDFSLEGLPAEIVPASATEVRSLLLRSANAQIRLMEFDGANYQSPSAYRPVPVQGPGVMHVCFQALEEVSAYARAMAAGAQPIGNEEPVALSSRNPVKYGYVTERNGIVVEIEEVDISGLDLPQPPKNSVRMRHVALATPDVERMASFWSAFLGDQEPRRLGTWFRLSGDQFDAVSGLPGTEIEMAWFQVRNLEFEIVQYHSHPTALSKGPRPLDALGYNMIVFDVANLELAKKRLIEAGGTIVESAGSLDDAEIVFGRDPDGNLIGLQMLPITSIYSAKNFADQGV